MPGQCGHDFGTSYPASGSIQRGTWYTVKIYVKSNTGNSYNGKLKVTIDGTIVLEQTASFMFGLDVSKNVSRFNIYTVFNYHQVNYNAAANWNLIDEFKHPVSFRHIAKGFGLTADFNLLHQTKKYVSPFMNFGFCYWSTGEGIDELYYNDGRIAKTRLNDVSRNGHNLGLGLKIIIPQ